jgi:hypothetical protein
MFVSSLKLTSALSGRKTSNANYRAAGAALFGGLVPDAPSPFAAEQGQNVSIGIAEVRENATPRLPLGRPDKFDSSFDKLLVGSDDVGHLKRNSHEAPDQCASFVVGDIHALDGELSLTGCHLRLPDIVAAVGRDHFKRLNVEPHRSFPVGYEHPNGSELIFHGPLLECPLPPN